KARTGSCTWWKSRRSRALSRLRSRSRPKRSRSNEAPEEGAPLLADGGAPRADAPEHGHLALPARADRDDGREGEGAEAVRGAVDHQGEAWRPPRPAPGRPADPG